jgi:Ran GTPase-activating protein (RanGAP) involved in mRNA processing and transport
MLPKAAVTGVDLSQNRLGDEGAYALRSLLGSVARMGIRSLAIKSNDLSPKGVCEIANALGAKSGLTALDVGSTNGYYKNVMGDLGALGLANLLTTNPSLHHLKMSCVGEVGFGKFIAHGLMAHCCLETLDVSDNWLTEGDCSRLLQALQVCTTLRRLDLSRNDMTATAGEALVTFVENSSGLTSLRLVGCDINTVGPNVVCLMGLVKAVSHSKTLTGLVLDDNAIGNRGSELLGKMLRRRVSLKYLSLGNCGIDNVSELALGVQRCPGLRSLNLRNNQIADVGAVVLARALCWTLSDPTPTLPVSDGEVKDVRYDENPEEAMWRCLDNGGRPGLRYLTLNCCGINEEGGCALVSVLGGPNELRRLTMVDNNIPPVAGKAFKTRIHHFLTLYRQQRDAATIRRTRRHERKKKHQIPFDLQQILGSLEAKREGQLLCLKTLDLRENRVQDTMMMEIDAMLDKNFRGFQLLDLELQLQTLAAWVARRPPLSQLVVSVGQAEVEERRLKEQALPTAHRESQVAKAAILEAIARDEATLAELTETNANVRSQLRQAEKDLARAQAEGAQMVLKAEKKLRDAQNLTEIARAQLRKVEEGLQLAKDEEGDELRRLRNSISSHKDQNEATIYDIKDVMEQIRRLIKTMQEDMAHVPEPEIVPAKFERRRKSSVKPESEEEEYKEEPKKRLLIMPEPLPLRVDLACDKGDIPRGAVNIQGSPTIHTLWANNRGLKSGSLLWVRLKPTKDEGMVAALRKWQRYRTATFVPGPSGSDAVNAAVYRAVEGRSGRIMKETWITTNALATGRNLLALAARTFGLPESAVAGLCYVPGSGCEPPLPFMVVVNELRQLRREKEEQDQETENARFRTHAPSSAIARAATIAFSAALGPPAGRKMTLKGAVHSMIPANARPLTLSTTTATSAATATAITNATAAVIISGAKMPVRKSVLDFNVGRGFLNPMPPLSAWDKDVLSPMPKHGPFSPGGDEGPLGGW